MEKYQIRPKAIGSPVLVGEPREADISRVIGARIRSRRMSLKISQEQLAKALGVTHQQVQKYEYADSAISAPKLEICAHVLHVPFGYFFDMVETRDVVKEDVLERFWISPEGMRLCRAYAGINNKAVRKKLMEILEDLSSFHGPELPSHIMLRLHGAFGRNGNTLTSDEYDDVAAAQIATAKSDLAKAISNTLKGRMFSQTIAGKLLRTSQARVSELARGKADQYSLDRLLRHLMLLGWCVDIRLRKPKMKAFGNLEVRPDISVYSKRRVET